MSASFALPSTGETVSRILYDIFQSKSVCSSRFSCFAQGVTCIDKSM